ncbi:MAG: septal ring lytic transglycosylase RlpA family protein [Hyphomonadaceae bacterium]|nr:septal ring lytic transglycosylase RlpA family protein [Hyphomonadaceae bacterium]
MARLGGIVSFFVLALYASASLAQAPITYAGRENAAPVQSASLSLAGGGDTSYGYGGNEQRRRAGAAIDVRTNASVVDESASAGQRPAWLEQEQVGPPYEANGRTYVPAPQPGYAETGVASWYGPQFHGRPGANGEVFDQDALTAAHPTLPLNSLVQVTNLENGRELIVRITDRGPFTDDRLIDLSAAGARALGFDRQGHTRVHVRYLGPAPRRVAADSDSSASEPGRAAEAGERTGPLSLMPPRAQASLAPASTPNPVGEGGYFIQVGAYSDLANAHRVRDQIVAAGPVTVDVRTSASGAELFRVRVGPLADATSAEDARRALSSLGFSQTIVASR